MFVPEKRGKNIVQHLYLSPLEEEAMKGLKQFIMVIIRVFFVLTPQVLISLSKAADIENGKKIYDQKCVFCHGQGGRDDGPVAATLSTSAGNFVKLIRKECHSGAMHS